MNTPLRRWLKIVRRTDTAGGVTTLGFAIGFGHDVVFLDDVELEREISTVAADAGGWVLGAVVLDELTVQ